MSEVERINQEWGGNFIKAFNIRNAAIVFAFALDKNGKLTICTTNDLTPQELKKRLRAIAETLGE